MPKVLHVLLGFILLIFATVLFWPRLQGVFTGQICERTLVEIGEKPYLIGEKPYFSGTTSITRTEIYCIPKP